MVLLPIPFLTCSCPEPVLARLRREVQLEVDKLLAIQRLVQAFNQSLPSSIFTKPTIFVEFLASPVIADGAQLAVRVGSSTITVEFDSNGSVQPTDSLRPAVISNPASPGGAAQSFAGAVASSILIGSRVLVAVNGAIVTIATTDGSTLSVTAVAGNASSATVISAPLGILEAITKIVAAIPTPQSLGLTELAAYLACPLLPLIPDFNYVDFISKYDPSTQLAAIKDMVGSTVSEAIKTFENSIDQSPSAPILRAVQQFEAELAKIKFDADHFARAVTIAAAVLVLCPSEINKPPYSTFLSLAGSVSFSGVVPGGLNVELAAVFGQFQLGRTKFSALRAMVL